MRNVLYIKMLLFNLIIVLIVLSAPLNAAVNVGLKSVLVLHSYHKGLGWTDSIAQGIDETFLKSNYKIETFTEYMDTKRIYNEQYLDRLAALLKFKYSEQSFNVIIASDDYAFHFLLKYHDSIFPETPAVFCGVNLFKDEFIKGAPYFTGVVESFSIKETIDAAMAINPNLRRVYSIVDKTVTGKANLELLKSVIPVFDKHLEFITITDMDMTEVTNKVRQLPPDSIILLLAFTSDRSGNIFSLEQSADLITAASNRPVYSFWDFHLNHGIIGGMLTTGISQGTAAANLALRILSGETSVDIPVIKTSPNHYIFDYNTLEKFSISVENLPPGSTVINRPPSFYEQYRTLVWQTLLLFGLLLAFTFLLIINLVRRRAAEVRLKTSEEKFRTIFENSVVGCFESTPEGRFISVNSAFADMLKYNSPEDVVSAITDIGKQYYVKPDDRNLYQQILQRNGTVDGFEFKARCKDGAEIWISNSTKAYFDENRKIVRYEGVVSDITKRKQAEIGLADSERKWRNVLINTPQIGIALDPDTKIVFANAHFLKLTGWKEQEVLGQDWFDIFIPGKIKDEMRTVFTNLMHQRDALDFSTHENEIRTKNGKLRNVAWSNLLTKDSHGNIIDITCLGIDLTERKRAEKEKLIAQQIAAEHEKYALVGQIAGKMAHDFNNILAAIMGNTELALLDCTDTKTEKRLGLIFNQSIRGKNLTKNLVAFAKDQEPKQEYFRINDKIELVLNLWQKELENIDVIRKYGSILPDLLADSGMIEHALVNLLQNSMHATSLVLKPQIVIRTYQRDKFISIEINDNGCGIPEKFLEKIFDPAFTLKGSEDKSGSYKTGIKGTGYGMSNVKKYIDQHKGNISIISNVGKGTKTTIDFPIIKKELTQKEIVEVQQESFCFEKYILLVEDEQAISDVQYHILTTEPCNHKVDVATNGQVAMDLFNRNRYDFVSLDYLLPGEINGMDVYHHIRESDKTIPILFVSGNLEFLESIKALQHKDSFIDHLSKPCQNLDYIKNINKLMDSQNN